MSFAEGTSPVFFGNNCPASSKILKSRTFDNLNMVDSSVFISVSQAWLPRLIYISGTVCPPFWSFFLCLYTVVSTPIWLFGNFVKTFPDYWMTPPA
uniref:Uncharacterized protein n=1 Tax=Pyxicephalus adspersus TaxID=30357 RepID=A0AAV3AT08_PYXAD|nr:TPA: hypothetical protein GDO54_010139 [Pyxicephalus adspersus]